MIGYMNVKKDGTRDLQSKATKPDHELGLCFFTFAEPAAGRTSSANTDESQAKLRSVSGLTPRKLALGAYFVHCSEDRSMWL